MLITATLLLITASWLSFLAPKAIHNYYDFSRPLGQELPPRTSFLLTMPQVWLIFVTLAVPLFVWVIARSRLSRQELGRMKLAMRLFIVVMLLAYGLAAWAIYLPVFRRGEVI